MISENKRSLTPPEPPRFAHRYLKTKHVQNHHSSWNNLTGASIRHSLFQKKSKTETHGTHLYSKSKLRHRYTTQKSIRTILQRAR